MSTMSAYFPPIPNAKSCQPQETNAEAYVRTRDHRLKHLIPPTVLDFEKNLGPQLGSVVLAQLAPMERQLIGVTRPSRRATTCGHKVGQRHTSKELPHEAIMSMGVKIAEKQRREYEHELKCRAEAAISEALQRERANCLQKIEAAVNIEHKLQLDAQKEWRRAVVKDYKEHLEQLKARRSETDRRLMKKLEESISKTATETSDITVSCEFDVEETLENVDAHARAMRFAFAFELDKLKKLQQMQIEQDEADAELSQANISMLLTSARTKISEINENLTTLRDEVEPENPKVLAIVVQILKLTEKSLPPSEILEEVVDFIRGFGCEGLEVSESLVDLRQTEILQDETCITTMAHPNEEDIQPSKEEVEVFEDSPSLVDKICGILKDFKFDLENPILKIRIQETYDNHYWPLTPASSKVGSFLSAVDSLELIACPRAKVITPPSSSVTNLLSITDSLLIHHDHIRKSMDLSKSMIQLVDKKEEDFSWHRPKVPKYFKMPEQPLSDVHNKMRVLKFKQRCDPTMLQLHVPPDFSTQPRRSSLRSDQETCVWCDSEHRQSLKHVQFGRKQS